MSFEQSWTLPRCKPARIFAAVRAAADRADLRFWCHEAADETMCFWVEFPTREAARLATVYSDLYKDAARAAEELDPLEGELDWEAAEAAGAFVVTTENGVTSKALPLEAEERFRRPARSRYTCTFDIDWERDAPVVVYSNEEDNRAAWPVILAFTDEVVSALGGAWEEG